MVKIKNGVRLAGMQSQLIIGIMAAESLCRSYNYDLVITSGSDGKHRRSSAHYTGRAFDMRVRHMTPEDAGEIATELQVALGEDFDVVLEHLGLPMQHIHVEYDPKTGFSG